MFNIRGMLGGKSKQTVSPVKMTASHNEHIAEDSQHIPVGHPRHQQPVSRQRGDGSWELLTGSSEGAEDNSSERLTAPQDTKIGSHVEPLARDEASCSYDSLESVSFALDTIRVDVDQMRKEEFEVQKKMPKSSYAGTKKVTAGTATPRSNASVRSKIPAPSQKPNATVSQRAPENEQPGSTSRQDHGNQQSPKDSSASLSGELSKGSPHFAQPTVAAVIRRETVRRDSAIHQGSATPEGSPTGLTRSTARRQNKRAPLPGGWTDSTDHPDVAPRTVKDFAASTTSPGTDMQQDADQDSNADIIKQEQSLRKKTSTSYMSPTTATTLRNRATMGQENIKRTSPRISRARPLSDINTTIPPVKGLKTAESIISDSGSEKIITEMKDNRGPSRSSATQGGRFKPGKHKSPPGVIPSDLRRRMTVGVSVADVLADHARSNTSRRIANTTRQRRESTGDLLNPIKARLNKVGLLAGGLHGRNVQSPIGIATGMLPIPRSTPEVPAELMEQHSPVVEMKPAFQPPHRRILAAKAAQAMSAAPGASHPFYDSHVPTPSLRATAAEFTPMPKPHMSRPAFGSPPSVVHDWPSAVKFRSAEEWAYLSPDDKRLIQAARQFEHTGDVATTRVAGQAHWQNIMAQHLASQAGPLMSYADVYGAGIFAGQQLRPYMVPGMSDIQRNLQGMDRREAAIHFDERSRSPIPRPNNFSPHRMPMASPNSWTIGADTPQKTFGWTGGAGREIKFVGYGPDAERDPNTPVSFNFRGGNTRSCSSNRNETGPRMVGEESFDGSPQAPLAPRSKAQWAKLKQYTQVPCKDMELTHAVELLPVPGQVQLAGYCNDCAVTGN